MACFIWVMHPEISLSAQTLKLDDPDVLLFVKILSQTSY